MATGIVLDPVYSGKAMHYLLQDMQKAPQDWVGRKVLFIHTGGLLVREIGDWFWHGRWHACTCVAGRVPCTGGIDVSWLVADAQRAAHGLRSADLRP